MNTEELEKIEIKKDGKNAERFESLLRTVVNVPREEIQKREAMYQKQQKAKKKSR